MLHFFLVLSTLVPSILVFVDMHKIDDSISIVNENNIDDTILIPKGEFVEIEIDDPRVNDYRYNQLVYDESMNNYMGINKIHRNLYDGITGFVRTQNRGIRVAVVDNLIDFTHPHLSSIIISEDDSIGWKSAVYKAVLINNIEPTANDPAYQEIDPAGKNPYANEITDRIYLNNRFTLYNFVTSNGYSHGTSVAGVINQIAPGAEIISVAMPQCSTRTELYNAIMNFLKWLDERHTTHDIKVVNISQ